MGAGGRGLGDTVTNTTGSTGKPLGDALGGLGTGVENGVKKVAGGVEEVGRAPARG